MILPTVDPPWGMMIRSSQELPGVTTDGIDWDLVRLGPFKIGSFSLGPLVVDRSSALLGLRTSTLIFTVVQSVNLLLITTTPEDLVWALSWFFYPLRYFGVPVKTLGFQLLLALRFLPLVQEELQNLLRAVIARAISFRKLGLRSSIGLILSIGERFLANILIRAEQGADALVARDGKIHEPSVFRLKAHQGMPLLNLTAGFFLIIIIGMRGKYGAF